MLNEINSDYRPKSGGGKRNFPDLPAGDYACTIEDAKYGEYNGDKNLQVTLKVTEGPNILESCEGRLIYHTFWLWSGSEKAQGYHAKKYEEMLFSLGYCKPSFLSALQPQGYKSKDAIRTPDDLKRIKTPFICVMKLDDYKKKVLPQWFNPAKKVEVDSLPEGESENEYAESSSDFGSGNEDLPF